MSTSRRRCHCSQDTERAARSAGRRNVCVLVRTDFEISLRRLSATEWMDDFVAVNEKNMTVRPVMTMRTVLSSMRLREMLRWIFGRITRQPFLLHSYAL